MFEARESIFKPRQLRDNSDGGKVEGELGGKTQQIKTEIYDATMISTETEIVRNRSHDTQTTDSSSGMHSMNSSGIHSLDLLKEIYPPFSDSELEHEDTKEECDDKETVIHTNSTKGSTLKTDKHDEEVAGNDLFLSYNKYLSSLNEIGITSQWEEGKPFDEESLRALSEIASEQGDRVGIVNSKDVHPVEEYILPPVTGQDILKDISRYDTKSYDFVKKSSDTTNTTAPIVHSLRRDEGYQDQSGSEPLSSSIVGDNGAKESQGKSQKFRFIAILLIITLLASGLLIGLLLSRKKRNGNSLNNETAAASSNLNDTSVAKDLTNSPTDSTQLDVPTTAPSPIAPSGRPWNDNLPPAPTNSFIETRSWGTLVNYLDPVPDNFFPLEQCTGDCDNDDDCDEGLICFQRGANDPVPFCYGGENDYTATDYCTFPDYDSNAYVVEPPSEREELIECTTTISAVQDCYFAEANVLVVDFENCNPEEEDWIGVFPDGMSFDDGSSATEWVSDDWIDWAFTCGDSNCSDSPTTNSFAFPTNNNPGYELVSLRVYMLRNTRGGAPYEIIAQSESFIVTNICGRK